MPKSVPIISDWSEEDRIALVRKWHPGAEVSRAPNLDKSLGNDSDQQAWYTVVTPIEDTYTNTGNATNTQMYKLTVEHCKLYINAA